MNDLVTQREAMRSFLRDVTPANLEDVEERVDDLEDAVVTGWILVCERMDVSGERWLSVLDGDAGDRTLTAWQHKGMLHQALYGMDD